MFNGTNGWVINVVVVFYKVVHLLNEYNIERHVAIRLHETHGNDEIDITKFKMRGHTRF